MKLKNDSPLRRRFAAALIVDSGNLIVAFILDLRSFQEK
jgi:hypothetical protein